MPLLLRVLQHKRTQLLGTIHILFAHFSEMARVFLGQHLWI